MRSRSVADAAPLSLPASSSSYSCISSTCWRMCDKLLQDANAARLWCRAPIRHQFLVFITVPPFFLGSYLYKFFSKRIWQYGAYFRVAQLLCVDYIVNVAAKVNITLVVSFHTFLFVSRDFYSFRYYSFAD